MSCNICSTAIPAMDPIIKCLACELVFDHKCAGMTVARARVFSDPSKDDIYLCPACKVSIPLLRKDFAGLKQELNDLKAVMARQTQAPPDSGTEEETRGQVLADLQEQIRCLNEKFDSFSSRLDVKSIVKQVVTESVKSMTETVAMVAAKAACHAVFEASRENEELKEKRLNGVVFGLVPDPDKGDEVVIKELAAKVSIRGDQIVKVFRAGPTSGDKPQLLKVGFASMEAKMAFIEGGRKNKFGAGIRVRRDLTFRERGEAKQGDVELC